MEVYIWVRGLKRLARSAREALLQALIIADTLEKLLMRVAILAMMVRELDKLLRGP